MKACQNQGLFLLGTLTALQNVAVDPNTKGESRAKVGGFLNRFRKLNYLMKVACYLDILELLTPVSKVCNSPLTIFAALAASFDS